MSSSASTALSDVPCQLTAYPCLHRNVIWESSFIERPCFSIHWRTRFSADNSLSSLWKPSRPTHNLTPNVLKCEIIQQTPSCSEKEFVYRYIALAANLKHTRW